MADLTTAAAMAYPLRTVDATPESSPEAHAQAPSRPAAVPAAGVWNAEVGKWEVSRKDAPGRARRRMPPLPRRRDAVLARALRRRRPGRSVRRLPPRTATSRARGRTSSGRLDGTVTAYASERPGGERIRVCCVPPGAARLCERYRAGEFLVEVFYDREGRAILSDGRLCPARPDGLPELAAVRRVARRLGAAQPRARSRSGPSAACSSRRSRIRAPTACGRSASSTPTGACSRRPASPARIDRTGRSTGVSPIRSRARTPTRRSARSAAPTTPGRPSGRWSFLDADGAVVRTVDRGIAVRDGDQPEARWPALADARGDWLAQARALAAEGRVREAFVAAARGAAATGDRARRSIALRADHVVPARRRNAKRSGARRCRSRRTRTSRRSSTR